MAAPPPSEVRSYTLWRTRRRPPLSFEPLQSCSGATAAPPFLAPILAPGRTPVPHCPPLLDALVPPTPLPVKCPITYRESSWKPPRKSQAAPRPGKYRFPVSLDTPAPRPSLSRMSSRPSFPVSAAPRGAPRGGEQLLTRPASWRLEPLERVLLGNLNPPQSLTRAASALAGVSDFIGGLNRAPRERKTNMADAPVWPNPSGRFSRTRRKKKKKKKQRSARQVQPRWRWTFSENSHNLRGRIYLCHW